MGKMGTVLLMWFFKLVGDFLRAILGILYLCGIDFWALDAD
jgi:hypothetical protein